MREKLRLPTGSEGNVWQFRGRNARRPDDWQPYFHTHAELEINLITRGQAKYLVGDKRHNLEPGVQIWLFPTQEHLLIDSSPDFEMWIAVFRTGLVRRVCTADDDLILRKLDPGRVLIRALRPVRTRELSGLHEQVRDSVQDRQRLNLGLGFLLLRSWTAHQAEDDVPISQEVHPAIELAARTIRDQPEHADLATLARTCSISPSRLSRLFKQQTGVALSDYRARQRLARFIDLYSEGTRMNLLEAALGAGFGSYPQFHRVFKRLMGTSPAEYRRGRT